MNFLDVVQKHVPLRRVSSNKGGEWHGPCPCCGTSQSNPLKSDRFVVWPEVGGWMCRNCGAGDDVEFLRRFESMTCPQAHEARGRACTSETCPVLAKCRVGRGKGGEALIATVAGSPRPRARRVTPWQPQPARVPAEVWRGKAATLVNWAHDKLLTCRAQLDYLAGRGLPLAAVKKYRLGWIPQDIYRPRESWGLPTEISARTGKPKTLWLPCGVVIPSYDADGVHRLQIRQPQGEPRYYWVPGGGDDVLIVGEQRRAHVVVESGLDALLVEWLAGDLVGAVPLGTSSAKPKQNAAAALDKSLCILVALDFEPRFNEQIGKNENPGGQAARWWVKTYEQAQRWPTPWGKDPGEYYQAGGDVRRWIIEGLPPGLAVPLPVAKKAEPEAAPKAQSAPQVISPSKVSAVAPADASAGSGLLIHAVSRGGQPFIVVPTPAQACQAMADNPGVAVLTCEEIEKTPKPLAEDILRIKKIFPGANVL